MSTSDETRPQTRMVPVAPRVSLALDEWPGSGRPVLFLHANGLSRGCWRPMAARLAARCKPFAADLRGHGGSSTPPAPYQWSILAQDVIAVVEHEGWSGIVVCGHSAGGATAVEVAAAIPDKVAAVVLLEPVLVQPQSPQSTPGASSAMVERALRRRARWESRAEAASYLRSRDAYASWDEEVFAGWCETGLRENAGGVELSCPPWVEASMFAETRNSTAFTSLARLQCPVWLARASGEAGMRSTCPPTAASRVPLAFETVVAAAGHFLPLERVDFVVGLVTEALAYVEGRP